MKKLLILFASLALVTTACSGNNEDNNESDTGMTVEDMGGGDEDTGGGGDEDTGGGGDEDTGGGGDDDMGGADEDMGAGGDDMGATEDMGGGDDMSAPDMGDDMGMASTRLEVHNCTYETAMDMTGMTDVDVTAISAWTFNHSACIIVDVGTTVSWDGLFMNHPLDGGESGTEDASSPIDIAGEGVTANTTISVTFDMAGDYPYYCGRHPTSMTGVVYVD